MDMRDKFAITTPNFVEIGRNVAEISRFLVFIVKIHLTTRA